MSSEILCGFPFATTFFRAEAVSAKELFNFNALSLANMEKDYWNLGCLWYTFGILC